MSVRVCDRVTEYVDLLHEHFVDPVVVKDGCYQVPQVSYTDYFDGKN